MRKMIAGIMAMAGLLAMSGGQAAGRQYGANIVSPTKRAIANPRLMAPGNPYRHRAHAWHPKYRKPHTNRLHSRKQAKLRAKRRAKR